MSCLNDAKNFTFIISFILHKTLRSRDCPHPKTAVCGGWVEQSLGKVSGLPVTTSWVAETIWPHSFDPGWFTQFLHCLCIPIPGLRQQQRRCLVQNKNSFSVPGCSLKADSSQCLLPLLWKWSVARGSDSLPTYVPNLSLLFDDSFLKCDRLWQRAMGVEAHCLGLSPAPWLTSCVQVTLCSLPSCLLSIPVICKTDVRMKECVGGDLQGGLNELIY